MEQDLECIILENNIEYAILEKIKKNDFEYVYLFNPKNIKDFCVRKLQNEILYGLDNEDELDQALYLLKQKNSKLIKKIGL